MYLCISCLFYVLRCCLDGRCARKSRRSSGFPLTLFPRAATGWNRSCLACGGGWRRRRACERPKMPQLVRIYSYVFLFTKPTCGHASLRGMERMETRVGLLCVLLIGGGIKPCMGLAACLIRGHHGCEVLHATPYDDDILPGEIGRTISVGFGRRVCVRHTLCIGWRHACIYKTGDEPSRSPGDCAALRRARGTKGEKGKIFFSLEC